MSAIASDLLDIIAKEARIPRERIGLDATMKALDVHSLDAIQVIFAVEDRFGITIPDDRADYASATVADLIAAVEAAVAKKAAAGS